MSKNDPIKLGDFVTVNSNGNIIKGDENDFIGFVLDFAEEEITQGCRFQLKSGVVVSFEDLGEFGKDLVRKLEIPVIKNFVEVRRKARSTLIRKEEEDNAKKVNDCN